LTLSESKDGSLRGKENGGSRKCSAQRCWKGSDEMGWEVPTGGPGQTSPSARGEREGVGQLVPHAPTCPCNSLLPSVDIL